MKTIDTIRATIDEDLYPSSDGEPMAETQIHVLLLMALYQPLRLFYQPRGIFMAANLFLYYREGEPKARRAPDIMAVKGIDVRPLRRSFKVWVEKAAPCWVLELTSKKTAKEDRVDKKQLYQELGVGEYFLFDPLHEYLPEQLMGYRLVDGVYKKLKPDRDGALISEELQLRMVPSGKNLLLYSLETGERLLAPDEAYVAAEEAQERNSELEKELEKERRQIAKLAREVERLRKKKNGE